MFSPHSPPLRRDNTTALRLVAKHRTFFLLTFYTAVSATFRLTLCSVKLHHALLYMDAIGSLHH